MPSNEEGINCHFITRWIVNYWALQNGRIWYFDFKDIRLRKGFSRTFPAMVGTHSRELDQRINMLIETPLKNCLTWLAATDYNQKVSDWRHLRSLYLYMFFQNYRFYKAHYPEHINQSNNEYIENTLMNDDRTIDEITRHLMSEFHIAIKKTIEGDFYCLPNVGVFIVPAKQTDESYRWVLAAPITPLICILLIPKKTDRHNFDSYPHILNTFSVGHNARFRNAIVPAFVKTSNSTDQLKLHLIGKRERAVALFQNIQEVAQLFDTQFRIRLF